MVARMITEVQVVLFNGVYTLLTFGYENADFIIRARVIAELKLLNRSTGNSDKVVTVTFLIPQIRHGWFLLISILLIRGNNGPYGYVLCEGIYGPYK